MNEWYDSIKYRDTLELDNKITFGLEIEFMKARRIYIDEALKELFTREMLSKPWIVKVDETLYDGAVTQSPINGEATSDILTDSTDTWKDLILVCDTIKKFRGIVTSKCGAHIHIGKQIFDDNLKYYIRLAKLWTIYEDVIIKFSAGEDEFIRDGSLYYAASNIQIFKYIKLFENNNKSFNEFVRVYSECKNLALSLRNLDPKRALDTLEVRCPNGTLNPIIWQNYVNFFIKFLLACKDDTKDWDAIDRKFDLFIGNDCEETFNPDKAIELADFIFDNPIDKINFLKQFNKTDTIKGKVYVK